MGRNSRTFSLPVKAYIIVVTVIFAAATVPIFIRNAQQAGASSLYIISVRLLLTSLILAPFVLSRYGAVIKNLPMKEWVLIGVAGFFFALNLLLLFISLEFTSVLVTSVLRRTTPLWVIWLEIIFLAAVFTRYVWIGLFLTLVGSTMVAVGGAGAIEAGSNPALGATLALVGSVSIGPYLLIGRRFRHYLPSLAYSWLVFSSAALITVAFAIITQTPVVGYSFMAYFWIIVVTAISQFLGHIPMNMSLHYFPATYVSIILQFSVVVSAVLALVLFNEVPSLLQVVGSIAIMMGVFFVSLR